MNADDADGCTKMCQFTCKADADCSDGNKCTGVETCNTTMHRCSPGTPVTCMGMNCTGTCAPATGLCGYADVDKDGKTCATDCNDADPAVFPGGFECKDGKDNDCSAASADATAPTCECYVDSDKDGYAYNATGAVSSAGSCPDKYTRRKPVDTASTDCAPGIFSVNPGQSSYFPTAYCRFLYMGNCISSSFDYNCSTMEEQFDATTAAPTCVGNTPYRAICLNRSGWVGSVPKCGDKGTYRKCSWSIGGACTGTDTAMTPQACR